MTIRIKNWAQFQHFKDRKPPWVKLYRDLLDDMEWHQLEPKAAKAIVMFWLIASESEGELPEARKLAFRLRITERELDDVIGKLSHWLEQSDIEPISERYQVDAPETETEKRQRRDKHAQGFEQFWEAYPKKKFKGDAEKAFRSVTVPVETLLAAIRVQSASNDWQKEGGRYIPYPASWLRALGWEDCTGPVLAAVPRGPDPALAKLKADSALAVPPPAAIREQLAQVTGKLTEKTRATA